MMVVIAAEIMSTHCTAFHVFVSLIQRNLVVMKQACLETEFVTHAITKLIAIGMEEIAVREQPMQQLRSLNDVNQSVNVLIQIIPQQLQPQDQQQPKILPLQILYITV